LHELKFSEIKEVMDSNSYEANKANKAKSGINTSGRKQSIHTVFTAEFFANCYI
jgi:hypothetical protein